MRLLGDATNPIHYPPLESLAIEPIKCPRCSASPLASRPTSPLSTPLCQHAAPPSRFLSLPLTARWLAFLATAPPSARFAVHPVVRRLKRRDQAPPLRLASRLWHRPCA